MQYVNIPKDWKVVKLSQIVKLRNGKRPNKLTEDGYPIYGANGPMGYTDSWLVDREFVIVIGRVGASGEVHLASGKIWVSDNAIYTAEYNSDFVYMPFLFYLLKFMNLKRFATKTTHPIITQKQIRKLQIPLPSLDEQRRIVKVLSTVDEAIAKTDAIISRIEDLRRALLDYLMTHGIEHREYRETEIGKIPKEWKIAKLKDVIFKALGGGTPSTKNLKYWNGDIPWMTSVGIPEDDIYITKGERFITEEGLKNSAANVIPKGNLIIATRVGLGKAGVNTIDIAINQDLVGLIIDKKVVIPEFLAYYIRSSRTLSYITAHARGTTIKGISKQVLFNLKVPIPALKEQREIVDILDDLNKLVKNESKRKEKLESVKKGLMTLLLTGKVSVKDLPID